MRTSRIFVPLLSILCLGLAGEAAWAQANNMARIYFVTPQPGHEAALEAAIKEHAAWRKQAGDPWTWNVMQVVNGENLGDFIIRSGQHTWADLDAYDAGFGPKGNAQWNEHVAPHVARVTSAITAVDMDHLRWPENDNDVNLIAVETYYLNPGQGQVFTQAVSKAHQAIVEHNRPSHYAFEWYVNGGEGEAVNIVSPHKNWADFQGPEENLGAFLARTLGEEEAAELFEQFSSTYHATKSWVIRARPDLSVLPSM